MDALVFFKTRGKIDENVWRFLLTGGVALENLVPNPATAWLSDKAWSEIVRASNLPKLHSLRERMYIMLILMTLDDGDDGDDDYMS